MTSILFRNARIFDGYGPELYEGHVLVENGRIKEVSDAPIAAGSAEVVEAGGRTLMPGMIDAHVHIWATDLDVLKVIRRRTEYMAAFAFRSLAQMLERGFTTVRDAGGTEIGYTLALDAGLMPGPRLLHAGRYMSQTGGHGDFRSPHEYECFCSNDIAGMSRLSVLVDGADAMRAAVRDELRKGAHAIKIMASGGVASPADPLDKLQFSDAEILAAVEETARHGTYVMAHCHPADSIRRAVELGVRSIEHGSLMDEAAADAVVKADAFVVPTLAVIEALKQDGPALGLPPVSMEKLLNVYGGVFRSLEIMRDKGVKVAFGTDLLGSQQDRQGIEFGLRARVFSPVEILRQATSVNAALIMREGELGCVRPGAVADLLLVDGDPLQNIEVLADGVANLPVILQGGRFHRRRI